MILDIIIVAILIAIDQLVKHWTVISLQGHAPIIVIDQVFQLTYVENRGAAFGMMQNKRIFFLLFTIIVVGIIYYLYLKVPRTKHFLLLRITALLFFAGALGNWIDRLRLSYVVDTFYFNLIDFPVFNVADSYVVISTIGFALLLLFYYKDSEFDFIKSNKSKKKDI